jgi:hypothetical protein
LQPAGTAALGVGDSENSPSITHKGNRFANTDDYRTRVYSEPSVGLSADFLTILSRVNDQVAVSTPVADFWRLEPGSQMLLGLDPDRRAVASKTAGLLAFLPGLPPKSISDRQGYVQARVDYLNYLFNSNAYLATSADNPQIGALQLLIPRIIVLVRTDRTVDAVAFQKAIAKASPFPPLEIHSLSQEIGKVGSDMYISLALANMRSICSGLVLALMRSGGRDGELQRRSRTLMLHRGVAQAMWRFVFAILLSPALVGLALGAAASVLAGFGLAIIWRLRVRGRAAAADAAGRRAAHGWVALLLIVIPIGVASVQLVGLQRHGAIHARSLMMAPSRSHEGPKGEISDVEILRDLRDASRLRDKSFGAEGSCSSTRGVDVRVGA